MKVGTVSIQLLALGRWHYVLPAAIVCSAGIAIEGGTPGIGTLHWLVPAGIFLLGLAAWTANEIADAGHLGEGSATRRRWGLYVSGGTGLLNSCHGPSTRTARVACGIECAVGLALIALIDWQSFAFALLLLSVGLAYSLEPIRLKARGASGPIASASAVVLTFLVGVTAVGAPVDSHWILPLLAVLLVLFASECIGHALDYEADSAASVRTIAVRLGQSKTLWLARLTIVVGVTLLVASALTRARGAAAILVLTSIVGALFVAFRTRQHVDGSLAEARLASAAVACCAATTLLFF